MDENLKQFLEEVEELFPYMSEENRNFFQDLKAGRPTSIPKQLEEDLKQREILEKAEKKARQEENLLKRKANGLRERERKARTRRLIEKGALLESLVPSIKELPTDFLAPWLEVAVTSCDARTILEKILLECATDTEVESEEDGEEVFDEWED